MAEWIRAWPMCKCLNILPHGCLGFQSSARLALPIVQNHRLFCIEIFLCSSRGFVLNIHVVFSLLRINSKHTSRVPSENSLRGVFFAVRLRRVRFPHSISRDNSLRENSLVAWLLRLSTYFNITYICVVNSA